MRKESVTTLPAISSLRARLTGDIERGAAELAALIGEHANDRGLVARIVMFQRELARLDGTPGDAQVATGLAILSDFEADQRDAAASDERPRREIVDEARARALRVPVPRAVVVECDGLAMSYRHGDFALTNVSFQARYGEITGVVGRNANGKTTLFRLVLGELRPKAGVIRFPALQPEGASVRWGSVRQQIAFVPQQLPPWYGSLRSNLHYEAATHGLSADDNVRAVDYIVERLGLADHLKKRWSELSGGFQLRFALARALVWKPRLLILDEPLASLDPFTQQIVLSDLRHLADSVRFPLAVLVSSQHLHEIEAVSDNLLLLVGGHMKFFGPAEDVGRDRLVNRFEMSGRGIEQRDLKDLFVDIPYHSLHYSGVAFVLTTPRTVTGDLVLQRLRDSPLPITYFRDISRSAKSVLQDDGVTP
jgi:ABC-2 type transport system ATP-binding protein